jgi:hypothetical protein
VIGVYDPADHARSSKFLVDLEAKVQRSAFPVVVLGDFNLIRGAQDKNNSNINWSLVNAFNDTIARLALREVARSGARFLSSPSELLPVSGQTTLLWCWTRVVCCPRSNIGFSLNLAGLRFQASRRW